MPERIQHKSHAVLATLALAAAGCLWGTGFLFGKIALEQMTVTENVTFRFLVGSLALLPVLFRRRNSRGGAGSHHADDPQPASQPSRSGSYTRRDLAVITVTAFFGVPVQFLIQFKGLQMTTVSHASLMVGTLPVFLAVSGTLLFHERMRWIEWVLLLVASAGAVLIALSRETSSSGPQATIAGDALVVLSMLTAVIMVMSSKSLLVRHESLHITALMIAIGTVMMVVWMCLTQGVRLHFAPKTWMAVSAQGLLGTAGAYLLWNWGLARVPASRAGVFLNMEPLLGAILGVYILNEHLGLLAIVGGAMIVASAVYFSTHPHEAPHASGSLSASGG